MYIYVIELKQYIIRKYGKKKIPYFLIFFYFFFISYPIFLNASTKSSYLALRAS